MSPLSTRCIRAAFLFLALGILLGVTIAFDRALGPPLRPVHMELNLWGWVTLLIYGMAYHMLPRFAGRPLRWPRLAEAQSWLAIAGVALVVIARADILLPILFNNELLLAGGLLQLIAATLFALLIGDLLLHSARPIPIP
jgi:hypothetical protein